eukprot:6668418-Pyramimonas_sp.AAC.1
MSCNGGEGWSERHFEYVHWASGERRADCGIGDAGLVARDWCKSEFGDACLPLHNAWCMAWGAPLAA